MRKTYKHYSENEILDIVNFKRENTYQETSDHFAMPKATVQYLWTRYRNADSISKGKRGRKPTLTVEQENEILKKWEGFLEEEAEQLKYSSLNNIKKNIQ